jgi:hypothetical protein
MNNEALTQLASRVSELEARLAIMDLEARYARTWDAGDGEGWAALYTENGTFDMAPVGQQQRRVISGTRELAEFCREIDAFYKGLHYMHLPAIQISTGAARARLHFQWTGLYNRDARYSGRRCAEGYYDVVYRKVADRWLIESRLEKAIAGSTAEGFDVYLAENGLETGR